MALAETVDICYIPWKHCMFTTSYSSRLPTLFRRQYRRYALHPMSEPQRYRNQRFTDDQDLGGNSWPMQVLSFGWLCQDVVGGMVVVVESRTG
jgi:hypothetical protein